MSVPPLKRSGDANKQSTSSELEQECSRLPACLEHPLTNSNHCVPRSTAHVSGVFDSSGSPANGFFEACFFSAKSQATLFLAFSTEESFLVEVRFSRPLYLSSGSFPSRASRVRRLLVELQRKSDWPPRCDSAGLPKPVSQEAEDSDPDLLSSTKMAREREQQRLRLSEEVVSYPEKAKDLLAASSGRLQARSDGELDPHFSTGWVRSRRPNNLLRWIVYSSKAQRLRNFVFCSTFPPPP